MRRSLESLSLLGTFHETVSSLIEKIRSVLPNDEGTETTSPRKRKRAAADDKQPNSPGSDLESDVEIEFDYSGGDVVPSFSKKRLKPSSGSDDDDYETEDFDLNDLDYGDSDLENRVCVYVDERG